MAAGLRPKASNLSWYASIVAKKKQQMRLSLLSVPYFLDEKTRVIFLFVNRLLLLWPLLGLSFPLSCYHSFQDNQG